MRRKVEVEIYWTGKAQQSFDKIIDWLKKEWSDREADKFIQRADLFLATLKQYPEICPPSLKRRNVRIGIQDKLTQLVYHYRPKSKRL
jgi:plasmid stabilization system protein ParE